MFPEFEHIEEDKAIKCKLCVENPINNDNKRNKLKTFGVTTYLNAATADREKDQKIYKEFCNVKGTIKKHLKSHIHKEHVRLI